MDAEETKIYFAILAAFAGIAIVVIYFVLSMVKQQRAVSSLQKAYAQAEINALEKDRSRIAADLHDELAPMLSAVKMKMGSFSLSDPEDLEQQQNCETIISELSRRMREISFDLMPASLLKKGVFVAVEEFIETIRRSSSMHITLHMPTLNTLKLQPEQEVHLYRIVQELVHNTLKHAGARALQIHFEKEAQDLVLLTADDGKGFHYQPQGSAGLGLGSILNRVNILNGTVDVNTAPGKGTRYHIKIPLS